jgi:separase
LRKKITVVFSRFLTVKVTPTSPLGDALLECLLLLSPKSRDEELEDFIYFILDLYQFEGVPVALADLDIDEIVVELRLALEDFAAKSRGESPPIGDGHLFLILDKNVQGIPWESLPVLKGKSVSRIPCLSFLLDRLDLPSYDPDAGGIFLNASRTYYILNPSQDLKRTEETFKDWAQDMHSVGWKGIVGRVPLDLEMTSALEKADLFLCVKRSLHHPLSNLPRTQVLWAWERRTVHNWS